MAEELVGFKHRFVAGSEQEEGATLLLLHGTGGNENDLFSATVYQLTSCLQVDLLTS